MKKLLLLAFATICTSIGYSQELPIAISPATNSLTPKDSITRTVAHPLSVVSDSAKNTVVSTTSIPHSQQIRRVRVAISGSYSIRLGQIASSVLDESKYKSGFAINGDIDGFFNNYLGLGGFCNYRQYNGSKVKSIVTGAKVIGRFYNRSKNSAFILGYGLGYLSYKEELDSYFSRGKIAKGSTIGNTFEVGYELGMYPGFAFMINLSMTVGSLGTATVNGQTKKLDEKENVSSFNLSFGFVFGR